MDAVRCLVSNQSLRDRPLIRADSLTHKEESMELLAPEQTVVHLAGNAVMCFALGIIPENPGNIPNAKSKEMIFSTRGFDSAHVVNANSDLVLNMALSCCAGEEAIKQVLQSTATQGPLRDSENERDTESAAEEMERVSNDVFTVKVFGAIAHKSCEVLVRHYLPEVKAVATALREREVLSSKEVCQIAEESLRARNGTRLSW